MDDGPNNEIELVEKVCSGDHAAFEVIFFKYYSQLCLFSKSYVNSLDIARDMVQDVFVKIWANRNDLKINQSLKAYLYTAVRNQSLNYLQQRKQTQLLEEKLKKQQGLDEPVDIETMESEEFTKKIWDLVQLMPERRRTIFILYRKHGLSYSEIAEVMGITRKTVENQMGKSLKFLRESLDL